MTDPDDARAETDAIIVRDPEIMSGQPVFRGTRVTVVTVFEHLERGFGLEEILESWPSLDRNDVLAVLRAARHRLLDEAA